MAIDLSSRWVYWLGITCVVRGGLSLAFNEFALRVQRFKPWWRDNASALRDDWLKEYQRVWIFAMSIVYIEVGLVLSQERLVGVGLRLAGYLLFAGWLLWRRRAFWVNRSTVGAKRE